jgi:membrane-associated protease RseP (regulator of RpoE activity)
MTELLPARPVPEPAHRPGDDPEASGNPVRLIILTALVVFAGRTGGWSLLAMIGALVVMIFLHELGHYLTARWAGMKVTEFFIGFGPRIWSFHRGETEYGLKVLPAGAYVKIVGMHNLDEFPESDADRTYMSKPFWRRLSVAVAGSTMHFIQAFLVLVLLFAVIGTPGGARPLDRDAGDQLRSTAAWDVGVISDDSAAAAAGVQVGDRVVAIDGVDVATFEEFSDVVVERPGESVPVVLERSGERLTVEVEIGRREDNRNQGFFGVGPDFPSVTTGPIDAIGASLATFGTGITETFRGIGTFLSPSGLADIGSRVFNGPDSGPVVGDGSGSGDGAGGGDDVRPVSIVGIADGGAGLLEEGHFDGFLALFAIVNIFIGIFNLLPLLPLDGGHVVIACYEKVRSMLQGGAPYHVDVVKLLPLTYAVVLVLAFLGISTIYLDIADPIGG